MFGTGRQERRLLRKFPRPLGEGRVRVTFSYNNHALTGRRTS